MLSPPRDQGADCLFPVQTCEGLTTLITEALVCGCGQPAIFMIIYSTSLALFITKMNMQNKQESNNTSL